MLLLMPSTCNDPRGSRRNPCICSPLPAKQTSRKVEALEIRDSPVWYAGGGRVYSKSPSSFMCYPCLATEARTNAIPMATIIQPRTSNFALPLFFLSLPPFMPSFLPPFSLLLFTSMLALSLDLRQCDDTNKVIRAVTSRCSYHYKIW